MPLPNQTKKIQSNKENAAMFIIKKKFHNFLFKAVLLLSITIISALSLRGYSDNLTDPAALPTDIFVKLAKVINPAVVNISTTQALRFQNLSGLGFNDPVLDFLFQGIHPRQQKVKPIHSLGTGFIINSDGLIVTNSHVIEQADSIRVQLMNRTDSYPAEVIGKDRLTDVALIKIKVKNLPVAKMGVSSDLQVGEWVAAFGNPYGHGHTMTKGIISAINRDIDELNLFPFLQTDASINPGNSGGPLVNLRGEVIGINTAMRTHGISFAIPIDNAKTVLRDLNKYGKVRRGIIGVQLGPQSTPSSKQQGVMVVAVLPDTPAEEAGLKKFDIITEFNNKKIKNYRDLFDNVAATPVNKKVPIKIKRNGKNIELMINVQERKEPVAQTAPKSKPRRTQNQNPSVVGFTMVQGNKQTLLSMGLPPISRVHPVVTNIKPNSPAELANMRRKDIIITVNGQYTYSPDAVKRSLFKNRVNILQIVRYRTHSNQYVRQTLKLNL